MKKTILATILLALSASMMTAQATVSQSFADQLMMQKTQLHPQEFNFISDRYKQVQAHKVENKGFAFTVPVILQPAAAKANKFYPIVGISFTSGEQLAKQPSFKAQLDSQKQLLRPQQFIAISDAYYQVTSH